MAQNYTEQLRKDNVRDAIYEDLQNNCEVLRTSWSGNEFPANPKVGQPCYRVDEDKLYYWDGYKWSQKGGGGSAELKTMELAAATSERVSITLEGARCLDKNMMFVFVDKIAQDPSTYSMNDDGTVVNFNPAIPANAAVTLRWFDTDVGTFDTAIFASDAEFAAGELTNKAPNVKQVHSFGDQIQTSNANYVKSELQSNLLNYTTNRILEIPQDIKLELNNGTLTLKSGSKVYIPKGFEADGITPKFDVITVENDIEVPSDNSTTFIYYTGGHASFDNNIYSGATFPSNPTTAQKFYKIDENCIYRFDGTNWNKHFYSLPLGFCKKATGSNNIVSIEQVFNGFGYIGSTVFALPGVKGAIPNGRNEDGTCKTTLTTLTSVKTVTFTNAAQRGWYLQTNGASSGNSPVYSDTQPSQNYIRWFSQKDNQWYDTHSSPELNSETYILPLAVFNTDSTGKIASFEPFTVDSVVNSNEFYQLKDKTVTTDTVQTISAAKTLSVAGAKAYSRPVEILMPTSTESDPTEDKTREIAFISSEGAGEKYEGSLTHNRSKDGGSYTGLRAGRIIDGAYKEAVMGVRIQEDGTSFSIAPSTPANAPSKAIATVDYLRNNYVTLNTNQTIKAQKVFNNSAKLVLLDSAARLLTFKSMEYDITAPAAEQYYGILDFRDKNNYQVGRVDVWTRSETEERARIGCRNKDGAWSFLEAVWKNEVAFATAPNPPITATGGTITTAKWVRDLLKTSGQAYTWSNNQNGYIKFSNGFIIQWGHGGANRGNSYGWDTITYPIAFTSFQVAQATMYNNDTTWQGDASQTAQGSIKRIGLTGMQCYYTNSNGFEWVAVGF